MSKIGFSGLAVIAALVTTTPSRAYLTYEDIENPVPQAYGDCIYHEILLTLFCKAGQGCTVQQTRDLQGNPISYPQNLCPPDVAFQGGRILYCLDPPRERCFTPPSEDKCVEEISLDCLCC